MIETGWHQNPNAPNHHDLHGVYLNTPNNRNDPAKTLPSQPYNMYDMKYTPSGRVQCTKPNISNSPKDLSKFIDYENGLEPYTVQKPLLSILIPTVPKRKKTFDALYRMLESQRLSLVNPNSVEIVTLCDNGEMMVGMKRNKLLDMARGRHLCFVDDDDEVFGLYLEKILEALKTDPDVVGITIFWTDDIFKNVRLLVRSLEYDKIHWMPKAATIACGRPAHLNPIRSSIAKSVRFPENVERGEDAEWSAKIVGKLKTCVTIDEPIYWYNFKTEGTLTQRPGARESLRPELPIGHQFCIRDGLVVELNERGEVVKTVTKNRAQPTEI